MIRWKSHYSLEGGTCETARLCKREMRQPSLATGTYDSSALAEGLATARLPERDTCDDNVALKAKT